MTLTAIRRWFTSGRRVSQRSLLAAVLGVTVSLVAVGLALPQTALGTSGEGMTHSTSLSYDFVSVTLPETVDRTFVVSGSPLVWTLQRTSGGYRLGKLDPATQTWTLVREIPWPSEAFPIITSDGSRLVLVSEGAKREVITQVFSTVTGDPYGQRHEIKIPGFLYWGEGGFAEPSGRWIYLEGAESWSDRDSLQAIDFGNPVAPVPGASMPLPDNLSVDPNLSTQQLFAPDGAKAILESDHGEFVSLLGLERGTPQIGATVNRPNVGPGSGYALTNQWLYAGGLTFTGSRSLVRTDPSGGSAWSPWGPGITEEAAYVADIVASPSGQQLFAEAISIDDVSRVFRVVDIATQEVIGQSPLPEPGRSIGVTSAGVGVISTPTSHLLAIPHPAPAPDPRPSPSPTTTPSPTQKVGQSLAKQPRSIKSGSKRKLVKRTRQGQPVTWRTKTKKTCAVRGHILRAKKRGTCRLSATAPGDTTLKPLRHSVTIRVK